MLQIEKAEQVNSHTKDKREKTEASLRFRVDLMHTYIRWRVLFGHICGPPWPSAVAADAAGGAGVVLSVVAAG